MESDLCSEMKCKNCKYFQSPKDPTLEHAVFRCSKESSISGRDIIKPDDSCFNGLFEKQENPLKELYFDIIEVLKEFIETNEDNYRVIAIWIIGTHFHDYFQTYPYLFINAMRGSGKTRLLKLIKALSKDGDMLASLSEAVLFRTKGALCIDEFEDVGSKEKNSLRELLNTAYKKGGKVKRMKKKKTIDGEEQVVEEFSTFRPLAIANIWGMEEVLGDRCLPIILEKSSNFHITRKVENFETHPKILKIREKFAQSTIWCSLCSVVTVKNIYNEWNEYLDITTLTTYNTYSTLTTLTTSNNTNNTNYPFFDKIYKTNLDGRNLELLFPLLLVAQEIDGVDDLIRIGVDISNEKKSEDILESKDISVFQLISNQEIGKWTKVGDLVNTLKWTMKDEKAEEWLNAKWMGRALKRLNLIIDKRRVGDGIEVTLNVPKAKEKVEMFR